MKRIPMRSLKLISAIFFFLPYLSWGQKLTSTELLQKSIEYHDPEGNWKLFKGTVNLEQRRPNGVARTSVLELINYEKYFQITDSVNGHQVVKTVRNNKVSVTVDGSREVRDADRAIYGLSEERIIGARNYYTYLYGLPMKLTDPGTNLGDKVELVSFNNKEYLELKVTYDAEVGSDQWFFYIDPNTYALEGYKFYHPNGNGEFITLEEEVDFDGIKIPKLRKWYTTNDSTYLGLDDILFIE